MAKWKSSDVAFVLLGPVNLTPITDKMEVSVDNPLKETTPFGVTAAQFGQPGLKTYSLTGHDGWFDSDQYTATSQMVAMANTQSVFMLALKGNTAGVDAVCAAGVLNAGLKHPMAVGEYTRAAMELGVSGVIDNAVIVAPLASYSGNIDTATAHLDLGATGGGTTGGTAYMSCPVLALTGSTNLILTIQDSADHATWADHDVFTALTAVGAQSIVSTDMTVNRYLAYKAVYTGLAGTPSATFVLAYKVNAPH